MVIKTIDQKSQKKIYDKSREEERQVLDLDFGNSPEKLRGDYLYMYEGIQSEVTSTTRFDDNSDLSTTYLDRIDITRESKIKPEKKIPISEQMVYNRKIIKWNRMSYTIEIQEPANHSCPSHIIYSANLYIHYQNLLLKPIEFK